MSAAGAIAAAYLVSAIVEHWASGPAQIRRMAGFVAGLGFGLSPLLWSQAVITEVYTLHAVLVALVLGLIALSSKSQNAWPERLAGLVCGLAIGNHLTSLLLMPAWLLSGLVRDRQIQQAVETSGPNVLKGNANILARRLVWLGLGLGVYLLLPLWARSGSPLNWGNPVDLKGIWWLVSGSLYQSRLMALPLNQLAPRLIYWIRLTASQYSLVGLGLGLYGLVVVRLGSRWFHRVLVYLFLVFSIFAIGYHTPDSYVLLIPAFLVLGVWLGVGCAALFEFVASTGVRKWLLPGSFCTLAVVFLMGAWGNLPGVDASQDQRAVDFANTVLSQAPPNAIVVTRQDEDTFSLWYYHFALGERPDMTVINSGSLVYPWYRARMQDIYADIVLKDHGNCYECMLQDLTTLNNRPLCETFWDDLTPLVCNP
jgi:hypothetical protein